MSYTPPSGAGLTNPMTTAGDIIIGGSVGAGQREALGLPQQLLGPVGSAPVWVYPNAFPISPDPTTTDGDLLYRKATTVTTLSVGFLGDSITAANPGGGTPPTKAVADLSVNGVTVSAVNEGVTGTSTSDWQPGGTNDNAAATALSSVPVVHIMLGTNDARVAVRHSAATYQTNLQTIVNAWVGRGKIVVLSYPPYAVPGSNSGDQDATANTLRIAYQAVINKIVNGRSIFLGDSQAYAYFALNSGELSDGIHPTSTGATDLAQMWANGLQPLVSALTQVTTLKRLTLGTNLTITGGVLNASGGGGGGGGSLAYQQSFLGADVTLTNANQFYAGPAITLAAGTWLIFGQANVYHGTMATSFFGKIWDGTSTIYSGDIEISFNAGDERTLPFTPVVAVLSGSTTVTLACATSAAGGLLVHDQGATPPGFGAKITYLAAVQIA